MSSRVLLFWPNVIGVDGWLARRLQQVSRFGAWLDVVVDNLSRAMLWTQVSQSCGWLLSSLEWCVFVCNHCSKGEHWKNSFGSSPKLIQAVMTNGFRTPLGLLVVSGLHCLPLWLYCAQHNLLQPPSWIQLQITALLSLGRTLAFTAEVWCVWTHIKFLTKDENEEKKS
ncbi:uncharacterized protein si:ch1073-145m9.1 isoform X2 [Boleophthalmus pectinirostris]|uniref:uncharacterized protein si:ch1073-145m9.1 isoform X2 n=1 Tax=Boleophthalmus pectinirostris TaxID=150288 RepID=UPI00242BF25A|nr:uncharacterized protein si:ch1073-145m9.1 isoform X2 [Boleophthalmus pectinirostris]